MDYEVMMNGNVRIGMYAPDFEAVSTMGDICLNDYKGKWVVLFSHPGDFTPVCTTEIIAFAKADTYFRKRNTCLVGLSVDSNASHLAWLYDIYCRTGIKVPFPIIADRNGTIARKYGIKYLYSDFKKKNGYKRSSEISNEYGMYRQNYCGCIFSVRDSD